MVTAGSAAGMLILSTTIFHLSPKDSFFCAHGVLDELLAGSRV
jgi:hypothetical protein